MTSEHCLESTAAAPGPGKGPRRAAPSSRQAPCPSASTGKARLATIFIALVAMLICDPLDTRRPWSTPAQAAGLGSLRDTFTQAARDPDSDDPAAARLGDALEEPLASAANNGRETIADQNPVVRVGALANRGHKICLAEWTPTAEYLSAQLAPKRFEIVPLDFDEVGRAAEQRQVEFLLVNSSMYVGLEHRALAYRIATFQQPSITGGSPLTVFGGVIFARSDRYDITDLSDLTGKNFAAVSPSSLGGWQAAWREFRHQSIEPEKEFAPLFFLGTHDAVVEAVLRGRADAGTVRSTQLERMALEGIIDLRELKILNATSAPSDDYPFYLSTRLYPEWPFAAVKGTDLELGKAVASALLRMREDDPAARASRGAGWAIPQDYASVHECLRELSLPPYKDYGKVTVRQAILQYWAFILGTLAIMATIVALALSAGRSGAKLGASLAALRESEQKYRSVVEDIQDVFHRVDAEGRLLLVSPSAARLLGYDSVNDLIGQSADILWADPSRRKDLLDELARNAQARDWEFEARRSDGSVLLAAATVRLMRDNRGKPAGYEGIWRDVTERKRAENILLARLRLSEYARTQSADEVMRRTVDEAEALTGSLMGFFHFFHQDQNTLRLQTWSTNTLAHMCTAEGKGQHYPLERAGVWTDCIREKTPVIHNDYAALPHSKGTPRGHPSIVRELVVPIFRGDRIVALLGVGNKREHYVHQDIEAVSQLANLAWDIILGRQAEEALRTAKDEWERTFDSMPELISILDTEHRIVRVNKTMADKLGRTPAECEGMFCYNLVHGTAGPPEYCPHAKLLREGSPQSYELFEPFLGGTFLVTATPHYDTEGRLTGCVHVARDISESKRAEEERLEMERRLFHSQKLESLGVLTGGIAHDFNNLLMAVLGNLDLALMDLPLESSARPSIDQAIQASKRAADLTRQMLAYSGKGRFVVRKLSLNELVSENVHMLKAAVPKTVDLDLQLGQNLPLIKADAGQMQQVVMNLITNAAEAMAETAGRVTLSTGARECDAQYLSRSAIVEKPAPGRFVFLQVTDTGCGMSEETRHRLFEPFFTTKFTGRGLGMSAVQGILRGHKGAILVESREGKGTTIQVLLPVVEDGTAEGKPATGTAAACGNGPARPSPLGTVLVVDDEDMVRNLCAAMVKRSGFHVLTAADGQEAVGLFRSHAHEIMVVILDLTMPRMDGVATFDALRRISPDVKVILSSGYNETEATRRFAGHGLAAFIQKPYQLKSLSDALARVRDGCSREPNS